MEAEMLFRRGDFIDCVNCGETIWQAVCEGLRGELACASMFIAVPPHRDPQSGDRFNCPACGGTVMRNARTGQKIKAGLR